MAKAMYIHIPFCDQICSYCDFAKIYSTPVFESGYITSLLNEIKSRYKGEVLKSLYFGGGTPSALSKELLSKLFSELSFLNLDDDCEITFEANPENLSEDKIKILKEFGVNRVSLGAQTFNQNHLTFLNRNHNEEDILKTINLLMSYNLKNINLDLMFGFPNQTLDEVKDDLIKYLSLDIPHISMYSLIIEEHTIIDVNGIKPIDEDLEASMYKEVINHFTQNNYEHYEISNFSKEGYKSRHNLAYWNNDEYYGFGMGAHGYLEGVRYENTRYIKTYNKGEWLRSEHSLTKLEMMQEQFFLGLRKMKGVEINLFIDRFDVNPYDIFDLTSVVLTGLVEEVDGYIRLTEKGKPLANEVFQIFV